MNVVTLLKWVWKNKKTLTNVKKVWANKEQYAKKAKDEIKKIVSKFK